MKNNILLVFCDQLSALALNIYGNKDYMNTPTINEIANNGVTVHGGYCTTPQCSPARSAMLTGLLTHRTGVVGNVGDCPATLHLSPSYMNIANYLKTFGYKTGYYGKWHLSDPNLDQYGFDSFNKAHIDQWDDCEKDDKCAKETCEFIVNNNGKQPWFVMTSFDDPHDIYEESAKFNIYNDGHENVFLPKSFYDDFSNKPPVHNEFRIHNSRDTTSYNEEMWKHYRKAYYVLIEKADRNIKLIMDTLKETGQMDNTTILFTADHGDMFAAHRCAFKGPMLYKELISVPVVIKSPTLSKDKRVDLFFSSVDVFPTLCGLINIPVPEGLDGVCLSEQLNGSGKNPENMICEYFGKQIWYNPIRLFADEFF